MDEIEREYLDTKDPDDIRDHNGYYSRAFVDWLKGKASRDSRILSAVPSEEEIEAWYIENYGVAKDLSGKPSWTQSIGYRTDGDLFEMLNDFAKWIKQRGIAG